MEPLVSIIIPCYNAERWIGEAIQSCLDQAYRPIEVVVVDDGSEDGSLAIIKQYAACHPEVIRWATQPNQGAPAARNKGLTLANGRLIFFLDADDYLTNQGLGYLVEAMRDDVSVAYGNALLVAEAGEDIGVRDQSPVSRDWVVAMMERSPKTGSVLFRASVAKNTEWDEELPCAQEYDYLVRIAIEGSNFAHVNCVVSKVRQHSSATRISVRTGVSRILTRTCVQLFSKFEGQLKASGQYSSLRRSSINYRLLVAAIAFSRWADWQTAGELYLKLDLPAARRYSHFRYLSYEGIASLTGLKTAHELWIWRNKLRRRRLELVGQGEAL